MGKLMEGASAMTVRGKQVWCKRAGWLFGLALFVVVWLACGQTWAVTLYVSDTTVEANLRTGTDSGHRIIGMLRPGTRMTPIREKDGWVEVTLEDGRTGWILSRYLSERPPWRITAERLEQDNSKLLARVQVLEVSQQELAEENSRLKMQVDEENRQRQSVQQELEELKKGAAKYLQLRMAYEKVKSEALQAQQELEGVQGAHRKLKISASIRWFLGGAGVFLVGWLLGLSMDRMRRRRSMDYYRL